MKKVVAIVIVLLLAGTAAAYGYRHWFAPERDTPAGRLRVYGNIEQRDAALAFPQPERIATVLVEEGDQVEAGQLLATQRTEQLGIRIATAEARVRAQQALVDELGHGARPEEIARARALHAAAEVRATNAERVLERVRATAESGASSAQELDDTEAAVEVARADAEATRQALQLVLAGAREEERRRAAAELDALQAQVALLRQQLADSELHAPQAGTIRTRILEVGEIAAAERPVFTLALTDPKWVRAFVPEPEVGRVHAGARATIRSDSFGGRSYDGEIGFVSPVAEFTPKAVETAELRTQLVYELHVNVRDPDGELPLGMPVTVDIDPQGGK